MTQAVRARRRRVYSLLAASSLVVGAFLAGLGLGSIIGAKIADRLSPARALILAAHQKTLAVRKNLRLVRKNPTFMIFSTV